jgi:ADP-heptose:LPS heptosyltransferase
MRLPTHEGKFHIWSVASGVGDELMALGAAQALEKAQSRRVVFHARHLELLQPDVGGPIPVPFDREKLPPRGIALSYLSKHRLSVIAQMALQLGLRPQDFPICLPSRSVEDLPQDFPREGQRIVLQTSASGWTPNKQWPEEHWRSLIEALPQDVEVIEVGSESVLSTLPRHSHYRSLVGRTSLLQFAACIQEADVFIGPVSGGMHLAHAYEVPSVIIIGGYEETHPYPLSRQFYTPVPCAPCWLRTPCPYDRACLRQISPAEVARSVISILRPI